MSKQRNRYRTGKERESESMGKEVCKGMISVIEVNGRRKEGKNKGGWG